ncbi:MAG: hypothetical protein RL613_677 [Fusobacteriota bacterium]|jgi:hypothetical protein
MTKLNIVIETLKQQIANLFLQVETLAYKQFKKEKVK